MEAMKIVYEDVGNMAEAYVEELVGFIDVAHQENKRILSMGSLI